jgi:glucose-1-phosphate thymidylyltransferase
VEQRTGIMSGRAHLAVILARGLGTRMRRDHDETELDAAQQAAAKHGRKAMMPVAGGRPFLDYILSSLADAGLTQVCLVVAPDHEAMRDHFARHPTHRVTLDYAVQPEPTGTADAVLAAEAWTAGRDFIVLNGDNLYPVDALRALADLDEPGLVAFDRDTLIRDGNIAPERIQTFALLDVGPDGLLRQLVEKPDEAEFARLGGGSRGVSMNVWRFDRAIFQACRDVGVSSRGERELPQAVALAVSRGMRCRVLPIAAGVLDLSGRGDVGEVSHRLAGVEPST